MAKLDRGKRRIAVVPSLLHPGVNDTGEVELVPTGELVVLGR
jgi:hypothetical protein